MSKVIFFSVIGFLFSCMSTTQKEQSQAEWTFPPEPSQKTFSLERGDVWVDPGSVGKPYGDMEEGILTFRGNPTRSYYGPGPLPQNPELLWTYPKNGTMKSKSTSKGKTKYWVGMGWTGQPAVFKKNGKTWVVFGAYDKHIHFLDAETGDDIIESFPTGDIVKGSVTKDPDGYPIIYTGSRDGKYRAIAIDRQSGKSEELWSLNAYRKGRPKVWNDDFDGSGLVIDDVLFIGGENSWFYIVKLNRGYDKNGKVTLDPVIWYQLQGFSKKFKRKQTRDQEFSIENSVNIIGNTIFFSNSRGLLQGWDISGVRQRLKDPNWQRKGLATSPSQLELDPYRPKRVFRFWTGDDTDATVVSDSDGMLYVASEWDKKTSRAKTCGQIMKIDPHHGDGLYPDDSLNSSAHNCDVNDPRSPLKWNIHERSHEGAYATPAIMDDMIVAPTDRKTFGIKKETGEVCWTMNRGTWSSPLIINNKLIMARPDGVIAVYDYYGCDREPTPDPRYYNKSSGWKMKTGGVIQATPTVFEGKIYIGSYSGKFFVFGDK